MHKVSEHSSQGKQVAAYFDSKVIKSTLNYAQKLPVKPAPRKRRTTRDRTGKAIAVGDYVWVPIIRNVDGAETAVIVKRKVKYVGHGVVEGTRGWWYSRATVLAEKARDVAETDCYGKVPAPREVV